MLPDRCSIKESDKDCPSTPEFVISIKMKNEEFMIGVTCNAHKEKFRQKLISLQNKGKIPDGSIEFSKLKSVGTDCIRMDVDELIRL